MPGRRSYTARLVVAIDVEGEPEGRDQTQRMQDVNALMLMIHAFFSDHQVANDLKESLQGWARDRTIDRVLIMPLDASHPDDPPR